MMEKEAFNAYMRRRYRQRREMAFYVLGDSCWECGSTSKLEIDHIDSNSRLVRTWWNLAWDKFLIELTKCQVLCQDCHIDKTEQDMRIRSRKQLGDARGAG